MNATLTVLVDNNVSCDGLQAEHGLAMLLRYGERSLLLDAAQNGETLAHNAAALGAALERVDAVVLSHGHYDHTGGLDAVLRRRGPVDVYAHPDAFARRWANKPGRPMKDISCPHQFGKLCNSGARFHPVTAPERLDGGVLLSGPIGGPAWGSEGFAVSRADEMVRDGFRDELFVLVRGENGWAVITGCCHRGLANTLHSAEFLSHSEPIRTIIGGLHLRGADAVELQSVVELLEAKGRPDVHPLHCTGEDSVAYLRRQLGECIHTAAAGSRIEL